MPERCGIDIMDFKKINLIILASLLLFNFFANEAVLALTPAQRASDGLEKTAGQAGVASEETDISVIIGKALNYIFGAVAIVFVTVILIGGYLWMAATGNEEGISKAKAFILNGIFGLMVIFISYALVWLISFALKIAALGK